MQTAINMYPVGKRKNEGREEETKDRRREVSRKEKGKRRKNLVGSHKSCKSQQIPLILCLSDANVASEVIGP